LPGERLPLGWLHNIWCFLEQRAISVDIAAHLCRSVPQQHLQDLILDDLWHFAHLCFLSRSLYWTTLHVLGSTFWHRGQSKNAVRGWGGCRASCCGVSDRLGSLLVKFSLPIGVTMGKSYPAAAGFPSRGGPMEAWSEGSLDSTNSFLCARRHLYTEGLAGSMRRRGLSGNSTWLCCKFQSMGSLRTPPLRAATTPSTLQATSV